MMAMTAYTTVALFDASTDKARELEMCGVLAIGVGIVVMRKGRNDFVLVTLA